MEAPTHPAPPVDPAERRRHLSRRIRSAREALSLSRERMLELLASRVGEVSMSTVRRWEDPEEAYLPDANQLWAWADLTGHSVHWFFQVDDRPPGGHGFSALHLETGDLDLVLERPGEIRWHGRVVEVVVHERPSPSNTSTSHREGTH